MRRTPIKNRVYEIVTAGPGSYLDVDGDAVEHDHTHASLASEIYGVGYPNAAQLSAVRRAVAKLVAEGKVERGYERNPDRQIRGEHLRSVRRWRWATDGWSTRTHLYTDPTGITVHPAPSEAELAARAARSAWVDENWDKLVAVGRASRGT